MAYTVAHQSNSKEDSGTIRDSQELVLPAKVGNETNPVRLRLYEMLSGNMTGESITLSYIIPKFLKITNRGTGKPITQLMVKYNGRASEMKS